MNNYATFSLSQRLLIKITMKKILFVLSVITLLSCNDDESSIETDDGSIPLETTYELQSVTPNSVSGRSFEYDNDQRITKLLVRGGIEKFEYVYDASGALTDILFLHTYVFDNDNLVEYEKYDVTLFTENEVIIRKNKYDGDDQLIEFDREHHFIFEGQLYKEITTTFATDLISIEQFDHDNTGRLQTISESLFGQPFSPRWTITQWSDLAQPMLFHGFNVTTKYLIFPDKFISLRGIELAIEVDFDEVTTFEYQNGPEGSNFLNVVRTYSNGAEETTVNFILRN